MIFILNGSERALLIDLLTLACSQIKETHAFSFISFFKAVRIPACHFIHCVSALYGAIFFVDK